MPPPTVSATQSSSECPPKMASVLHATGESQSQRYAQCPWEEPHPGLRLVYVAETTQPAWGHGTGQGGLGSKSGGCRDGMAAKAWSPHYYSSSSWMVRRNIRMRNRMGTPRPLKLPVHAAFEGGSKSAPIMASAERLIASPVSASTIKACTAPSSPALTTETQDSDMDTVMEVDMEADIDGATTCTDATETDDSSPSASSSPPMAYALSDVSNLLGVSDGVSDRRDDAVTIVDPEAESCCVVSSAQDAYGWEAELDRKLKMEAANQESCMASLHSADQSRKGLWRRGSLLHRVLSLGRAEELAHEAR